MTGNNHRPTTAHLEGVANAALQSYLPKDWKIQWLSQADREKASTIWAETEVAGGKIVQQIPIHHIQIPHPEDATSLFILLHELGHIYDKFQGGHPRLNETTDPNMMFSPIEQLLGFIEPSKSDPEGPYTECRASRWARAYMEQHNIPIPKSIWRVAMEEMHKEENFWRENHHPEVELSKDIAKKD